MKRLFVMFMALVLVISMTACGNTKKDNEEEEETTEEAPPAAYSIESYREEIAGKDALIGVAYLGSFDHTAGELIEFLNVQDYWDQMIFLENVDTSKICRVEFGYELYVVLPLEGVSVTVYECKISEEGELLKGNELLKSDGEPFFLNGNVSDIIPDFIVVAEKDGKTVEYSPRLSLKNGLLEVAVENVHDITPYGKMSDFIYSEQTEAN